MTILRSRVLVALVLVAARPEPAGVSPPEAVTTGSFQAGPHPNDAQDPDIILRSVRIFRWGIVPALCPGATLPDPWPIRKILTHVGHCRFAAPESACENRRKMVLFFDSRMLLFTQSKPKTRAV